jgi:signal transduction histidine kinase
LIGATTTFAVALLYAMVFRVWDVLPASEQIKGVRRHWLGDMNGILTLAPVLFAVAAQRYDFTQIVARRWELLLQIAALMLAMAMVLVLGDHTNVRFFYVLFAPAVWIAFRWGVLGAALCTLSVQLGLVIDARGQVDFPPVVDLQLLMITLETTALLLGAVATQHEAARKQIAAREMEQRALLTTAPDGVLSIDASGRIVLANPAALLLFDLLESALVGQPVTQRLPELALGMAYGRGSTPATRGNGNIFPADVAWARLEPPAATGFILIIRDASERLLQERRIRDRDTELARATRFAMLGELASALAHELNQPITASVSYLRAAQILAASLEAQDPRLGVTLNKAAHEALRASEVLKRLRDFYRGGAPKLEPLGLEDVLSSACSSYEERFRQAGVHVQRELASPLPVLNCDAIQLEMILLNLLGNALDAVLQRPAVSRQIHLSAFCRDTDVLVVIEDSGHGLAPDVEARLFAPFVTTKADGMGLGLAISRSLLRNQGGDIWAEPAQLGGARFIVRIPSVQPARG